MSASQLGGIFDTLSHNRGFRPRHVLLSFAFGFFLLSAILAAGLYGVYIDHEGTALACSFANPPSSGGRAPYTGHCSEWLGFQTNLYTFSIVLAVIVGGFGTVSEWIRTRRQP